MSATRRRLIAGGASALAARALIVSAPVSAIQFDRDLIDLLFTQEQAQVTLYSTILDTYDDAAFAEAGFGGETRSGIEQILAAEQAHLSVVTRPDGPRSPALPPPTLSTLRDALGEAAALENLVVASYAFVVANIDRPRMIGDLLGIHSVEARQASWLSSLIGTNPFPLAIDLPLTLNESTGKLTEPTRGQSAAATPAATPLVTTEMEPIIVAIAQELGVPADAVTVLSVTSQTWPDTALGCPEPGMMYAQVLTPGYLVVVETGGESIEFHTDERGTVVRCT